MLTGGGDAPGLNAVIRAVVKAACNSGIDVIGLEDSFDGLLDTRRTRPLTPQDVTGILRLGGTILGTTNRGNPFEYPADNAEGKADYSDRVVETFQQMRLDALVAIGGDGTLAIAHQFYLKGIPIVGVPKTIDNDIVGTTTCFGFDTAVAFAADAIECSPPRDRREPCTGIVRHTMAGPGLEGVDDGVLYGVLGEVEVTGRANEGGQYPATLMAHELLE